jgi:hypothetical protein
LDKDGGVSKSLVGHLAGLEGAGAIEYWPDRLMVPSGPEAEPLAAPGG